MSTEVRVPTLGESVTEATVATWFKKAGDTVAVDEMLCELETDNASAPDHRPPPQGSAGQRRHADHLQRGGYGRDYGIA